MKAIIFAAGLGTRLKPRTNLHPKCLALVQGKTILEHIIIYLQKYDITDVIINVFYLHEQIRQIVDDNKGRGSNIAFLQGEQMLDTGEAIYAAQKYFIGEANFIAINADIITDINIKELINTHLTNPNNPLSTIACSDRSSSRNFLFDETKKLVGRHNNKTGSSIPSTIDPTLFTQKAFNAIHIINTRIFNYPLLPENNSITNHYLSLASKEFITYVDTSHNIFIDIGSPEQLKKAQTLKFN